jgi:hypothetical protein
MSKNKALSDHYETIVVKLESIVETLDDLMEDPLFIDHIHGEQEMSLDLAHELFGLLIRSFSPQPEDKPYRPLLLDSSYDAE